MKKTIMFLFILLLVSCNNKPVENNTNNNTPTQGCDIVEDCGDDVETSHLAFKDAYEALNGTTNSSGKENRTVNIDEVNPFIEVEAGEIIRKIENKETFYIYIGDEMCPWCRSVIETSIDLSKQANIENIYYVQIWDDDHNEILRDQYKYEDGKLNKVVEGTDEYHQLLKYWDNVLEDYTLTVDDNEIEVGEKRIYAPNFVYVENGEAVRFTTGISSLQEDAREELNEEMLNDMKKQFTQFFGLE